MRRFLEALFVLVAGVGLGLAGALLETPSAQRRPVPNLEQPSPAAPTLPDAIVSYRDKSGNTSGTAFAVASGWWLTARHAATPCRRILVQAGPHRELAAREVLLHPTADLALLQTGPPAIEALPTVTHYRFRTGQVGFGIGYPKGRPGQFHADFLGHLRLRGKGRLTLSQAATAWAVRAQVPESLETFGGISGGPLFDEDGRVVGAVLAGSVRRGRQIAADPATFDILLRERMSRTAAQDGPRLDGGNYVSMGNRLRSTGRIARVLCLNQ